MDNALEQMLVKNIMENFPEASSSLQCVKWRYDDCKYVFVDEDETVYKLDKEKLLSAVPLIFTDKWGKGLTEVPSNLLENEEVLENWLCQADAWDFDAFVQLAIFGEVIYG